MAVIKANNNDLRLIARLIRAEAEEDGNQGMLAAGTVMVNRVRFPCSDFEDIRTVEQMVFQTPAGFEATEKGYFYQRARDREINLARRLVRGERQSPATRSLWFFRPNGECPPDWFGQPFAGQFKSHCFYDPLYDECPEMY
ncbi:N-acetylmuramoyl-L-alanine amidase [Salsuginibacillus halophilus]|uniref:N-acetylmuramoyl-L-alanine amidase n=1 Tax=Salsuginibacillus halophilus TaxID=517424 RepID=A0A2P8HI27_9BACI|nr:cell wall hydrolase [Salsuginibacillus halophilus]PSL45876.1 N-acetylmuramoyl-L-alanine amidase [Salsuginibacillus halophilus]